MDRRDILGGLGASVALVLAYPAKAECPESDPAPVSEKEKIVNDFCRDWATRDASKLTPYLDAGIEYHMFEGAPPIMGLDTFTAQLSPFMAGMEAIEWEIIRSTVMGDIVLNERIDHFIRKEGAEGPDNHFHIVGVFLVRGGKIKYWKDYNVSGVL